MCEERRKRTAGKTLRQPTERMASLDLARKPRPIETPPAEDTRTVLSGASTPYDLDGASCDDPRDGEDIPF
jgi:hypothetical protein